MPRRDDLWTYRAEVAHHRYLGPAQEADLAIRARSGDRSAARRLVEGALVTVLSISAQYRRWGVPLDDLVQEGNLGLLRAVDRYDPAFGVRLSTYAAYWIREAIREHVARHFRIVRLGSTKAARRALRLFRKTRESSPERLAAMSGLPIQTAEQLLPVLLHRDVSLSPRAPDDGPHRADSLVAPEMTPEEALLQADEQLRVRRRVEAAMARLAPREQDIVRRRHLTEPPVTLERIGATWGVTKERVRQLEASSLVRLRHLLANGSNDGRAAGAPRTSSQRPPGTAAENLHSGRGCSSAPRGRCA